MLMGATEFPGLPVKGSVASWPMLRTHGPIETRINKDKNLNARRPLINSSWSDQDAVLGTIICMRESGIAAGFGYFTPRNQAEKMRPQITSRAILSQLASGPNAPPVSHAGPWKLAFKRFPCATCPLEGTP